MSDGRASLFDHADIVILVKRIDGTTGGWECEVGVEGQNVGGGTGGSASAALSVAMDILYGDTNDHLNGDFGAIEHLGNGVR